MRGPHGHLIVLECLKEHPEGLTVAEMMLKLGRSERVIQRHLKTLGDKIRCDYRGLRKVWSLKGEE